MAFLRVPGIWVHLDTNNVEGGTSNTLSKSNTNVHLIILHTKHTFNNPNVSGAK